MGQTLTHGIYLPDEGERNCYDGLASNWQLLDGAVGTVAEHTSALAGKAPLVHTHTKSDITDLFNSANTWSALNTYSNGQIRIKSQSQEIGVIPSSDVIQYLEFADKNDAQHGIVGLWDYANGASEIQMYISDKFKNGAKDPTGTSETTIFSFGFKTDGSKFVTFSGQVDNSIVPKVSSVYDLGTSAYIWNNVYANTVNAANAVYTNTVWAQSVRAQGTSNALILAAMETWEDGARIFMYGKDSTNGSTLYADVDHNDGNHSKTGVTLDINGFYPSGVSRHLGLANTNYKWLTFNGTNPGALSLPNSPGGTGTVNVNYYDLSGDITVRDGSAANGFTAPCDGWISIETFATWLQISNDTLIIATTAGIGSDGFAQAFLPVRKGNYIRVVVNQTNTQFQSFKLLPCEGNV